MLDSELECKTLSKENQRLRNRIRGLTILLYAVVTALGVFLAIAVILSRLLARTP